MINENYRLYIFSIPFFSFLKLLYVLTLILLFIVTHQRMLNLSFSLFLCWTLEWLEHVETAGPSMSGHDFCDKLDQLWISLSDARVGLSHICL